jgi:hypothetical protein
MKQMSLFEQILTILLTSERHRKEERKMVVPKHNNRNMLGTPIKPQNETDYSPSFRAW